MATSVATTTADLTQLLNKLLNDQLDQFEVLSSAERLSVNFSSVESFSQQKYLLQAAVLEQLLRSSEGNTCYHLRLLEETRLQTEKEVSRNYQCCLIGCLFQTAKHRKYLQHVKTVHSSHESLLCNFMHKCERQFSSFQLLLDHVKEIHGNAQARDVHPLSVQPHGVSQVQADLVLDIPCKCDMISCGGKHFASVGNLMTHINTAHVDEERWCIFDKCSVRIKRGARSNRHFHLKHSRCV